MKFRFPGIMHLQRKRHDNVIPGGINPQPTIYRKKLYCYTKWKLLNSLNLSHSSLYSSSSLLPCSEENKLLTDVNTTSLKHSNSPQHFILILRKKDPRSTSSYAVIIGCRYAQAACCTSGSLMDISRQLSFRVVDGDIIDGVDSGSKSFRLV